MSDMDLKYVEPREPGEIKAVHDRLLGIMTVEADRGAQATLAGIMGAEMALHYVMGDLSEEAFLALFDSSVPLATAAALALRSARARDVQRRARDAEGRA